MNNKMMMAFLNYIDTPIFMVDEQYRILFKNGAAKLFFSEASPSLEQDDFLGLFDLEATATFPTQVTLELAAIGEKTILLDQFSINELTLICAKLATPRQSLEQQYTLLNEELFDLRAVFEHSYDGIMIVDGKGYGRRINESYARVTGLEDAQQMIGMHMSDVVKKGIVSESISLKVLEEKKFVSTQPRFRTDAPVLMTGAPVFDEAGNIVRVITNVRDISELMKLHHEIEETKNASELYYTELMHLRSQHIHRPDYIAESPAMLKVVESAMKLSKIDVSVLITGASGVGKGALARLIHEHSERAQHPFITINCGAIPENLLESELFGYEKGAFTNASNQGKPGLFELAKEGTLFLDEIGELPLSLQVKLLGVLQDRKFLRIGGIKEKTLDARILSATNQNLEEMILHKTFRKDLYYRLFIANIMIPDLRTRTEDIFALILFFQVKYNKKYKKNISLTQQAVDALSRYDWPGNIRQLSTVMEQIIALSETNVICAQSLPLFVNDEIDFNNDFLNREASLKAILDETEKSIFEKYILQNLSSYKIAKILKISQATASRKIKKYRTPTENNY